MTKFYLSTFVFFLGIVLTGCPVYYPKCYSTVNEPPKLLQEYFKGFHTVGNYFIYKNQANQIDCLVVEKVESQFRSGSTDNYAPKFIFGKVYSNNVYKEHFQIIYSGSEYESKCSPFSGKKSVYFEFRIQNSITKVINLGIQQDSVVMIFSNSSQSQKLKIIDTLKMQGNLIFNVLVYNSNFVEYWIAPNLGIIKKIDGSDTFNLLKFNMK